MIDLLETSDGVVVCVRAQPRARANAIRGEQAGALKVSVTQAAEKGKANRAILDLLARSLNLRKSQLELIGGETAALKKFLVRGITLADLHHRLAAVLS
jgi:uncharacterized protein YggU (UPF0235/DUF167 family)